MARESVKQRLLLTVVSGVAAIGGLLFGYDTGVISGAILFIREQFHTTIFEEELIISMVSLGAIFGAIIGGPLADRIGRKKIVLTAALMFVITALGIAMADGVTALIIWRFFIGFSIGVSSATAPLYIAEFSPRVFRGTLVTINQLAITVGILLAYVIGLGFSESGNWRLMFALAAIPAGIQFIIMCFFSESPRWLINHHQRDKALSILKRYRASSEDAELEVQHIEKMKKVGRPAHWKEMLEKNMRPALMAGIGLTIIQQITGINTIIYYAPTIFQHAGFATASAALYATMWVGIVNVVMTFLAIFLLDVVGRKPLLYAGLIGIVLSLFTLGLAFLFDNGKVSGIIAIISMLVYIGSFAYSLGPIGWLLNSEIYPLHIRGKAMGVATCANWLSNFIITLTFLNLVKLLGTTGTFWLYGVIGIIGILFVWRKIPETKGKSLEEIEEGFRK